MINTIYYSKETDILNPWNKKRFWSWNVEKPEEVFFIYLMFSSKICAYRD